MGLRDVSRMIRRRGVVCDVQQYYNNVTYGKPTIFTRVYDGGVSRAFASIRRNYFRGPVMRMRRCSKTARMKQCGVSLCWVYNTIFIMRLNIMYIIYITSGTCSSIVWCTRTIDGNKYRSSYIIRVPK